MVFSEFHSRVKWAGMQKDKDEEEGLFSQLLLEKFFAGNEMGSKRG